MNVASPRLGQMRTRQKEVKFGDNVRRIEGGPVSCYVYRLLLGLLPLSKMKYGAVARWRHVTHHYSGPTRLLMPILRLDLHLVLGPLDNISTVSTVRLSEPNKSYTRKIQHCLLFAQFYIRSRYFFILRSIIRS